MNVLSNNLAKLIKRRRIDLRISQTELSNKLGYGSRFGQTISNVERGTCQLPAKYLNKLSICLMISREAIIAEMVKDYQDALIKELNK
jgi:transcriptional regulator with XRE-family HTH domain